MDFFSIWFQNKLIIKSVPWTHLNACVIPNLDSTKLRLFAFLPQAYSEPCETAKMERFLKSSKWIKNSQIILKTLHLWCLAGFWLQPCLQCSLSTEGTSITHDMLIAISIHCNFNTLQSEILQVHCVKSVRIRSYSGPYSVQMRKNTDQNNSEYGHFSRSGSVKWLPPFYQKLALFYWENLEDHLKIISGPFTLFPYTVWLHHSFRQ